MVREALETTAVCGPNQAPRQFGRKKTKRRLRGRRRQLLPAQVSNLSHQRPDFIAINPCEVTMTSQTLSVRDLSERHYSQGLYVL